MRNGNLDDFRKNMNRMAGNGESFLFLIDFSLSSAHLIPTAECRNKNIFYDIEGISNFSGSKYAGDFQLKKHTIPYPEFLKAYNKVQNEIHKGNSYLVNLTFSTPVETRLDLFELYQRSTARYKLYFKDEFLVFSPEIFVKMANGKIQTFPMKGTIDASLPDAEKLLLENKKETAEHATIVDLLRNDLSRVAKNVRVEKYRYIEKINTLGKNLLQMSSVLSGDLPEGYMNRLGDIMISLLPAGSISGAPKKTTLEIIAAAETHERGFYTGVFGLFDGLGLNSGVMIRFIEKQKGKLVYKSGGGITSMSNPLEEYQEMIDKIYVPVN